MELYSGVVKGLPDMVGHVMYAVLHVNSAYRQAPTSGTPEPHISLGTFLKAGIHGVTSDRLIGKSL